MVGKIKNVGKIVRKIFFLCLGSCLLMGCSLSEDKRNPEPSPTAMPAEPTKQAQITPEQMIRKGFYFVHKGVEMSVDMPAADILKKLGSHDTYFEAASCAVDGVIRTYGYGSFEIDTYELLEEEYISCIYFKDDTVMTEEGAYLFMTKEQLLSVYGEDYAEEGGMLVYYKDGQKLKFLITNGEVSAVQYMSPVTDIVQ